MRYFDSHSHLNDPTLFNNWQKHIDDFVEIGGKWIINIWVDNERNQKWIHISRNNQNKDIFVKSSIWYHPSEICFENIKKTDFNQKIWDLKELYENNKSYIVGVWECWIDLHYPKSKETLKDQKEFFGLQCDLAQELALPIIIHSRDDFESTFDIVKNYKNSKIYFHCWGYWTDEIKKLEKYFPNIRIWFCGNITYPKAHQLRESIKSTNLNNILLETDGIYLTPQIKRWEKNNPSNIKYIYNFVEELLNIEENKFQKIIEDNFIKLYY